MPENTEWLLPVRLKSEAVDGTPEVWVGATLPNFVPQQQMASRWCWAAVASTIATYYQPQTHWQQCAIVTVMLNRQCCVTPLPEACNQYGSMSAAMQRVGARRQVLPGRPPYNVPVAEINALRPPGVGIEWFAGGSHALSLYGYRYEEAQNVYQLLLADPWHNAVFYFDYWAFPERYEGGAVWIETICS